MDTGKMNLSHKEFLEFYKSSAPEQQREMVELLTPEDKAILFPPAPEEKVLRDLGFAKRPQRVRVQVRRKQNHTALLIMLVVIFILFVCPLLSRIH